MQDFPIQSVSDLEKISNAVKWQYFEKLVAFIFRENGFDAKQNIVVKDSYGNKRQFDVIAKRYGITYLVECKKWKSNERKSALKSSVKKHLERCVLYEGLHGPGTPLIVTLLDDNIAEHEGVVIVPIMKLNSYINDAL